MNEFPKLMWRLDGTEVTVRSLEEQEIEQAGGARLTPELVEAPPEEVPAIFEPDPAPAPQEVAPLVDGEVVDDEPETAKKRGSKKK